MSITHHPGEELLIAYASGTADEAVSLIVATHIALCPQCRRAVRAAEAAGGVLLEDLKPARISDGALKAVLSRLDSPVATKPPVAKAVTDSNVPEPLRSYIGGSLQAVSWIPVARGLAYRPLFRRGASRAQLVRSAPGAGIAMHTHRGEEFTLVLEGGYGDTTGHYLRGDLQSASAEIEHRPIADEGGYCFSLAVVDAPLSFRSSAIALLAKVMGL
ncbi:MAG: cupin domain-containing protein [Proteobacteria bacterium]|nr:cupin domain-containing protein [Pseudomonadota bacterium]